MSTVADLVTAWTLSHVTRSTLELKATAKALGLRPQLRPKILTLRTRPKSNITELRCAHVLTVMHNVE